MRGGWLLTLCLVGCGAEIGGDDEAADATPGRPDGAPGRPDAGGPLPDAAPADTQTTVFGASDMVDNFLRLTKPTFNYGVSQRLCADTTTDDRRILLRIDVSSIPAGAEVVGANLHIWTGTSTNDLSPETFSIYRMLESWNEGSKDAAEGVASWNERKSGTAWTVAGAGNGSRDDVAVGSFVPAALDTEYIVPLDPALISGWVSDVDSNNGIQILAAGSNGACFASSEFATASRHPSLSVSWVAP